MFIIIIIRKGDELTPRYPSETALLCQLQNEFYTPTQHNLSPTPNFHHYGSIFNL